jgi:hypothetical protein
LHFDPTRSRASAAFSRSAGAALIRPCAQGRPVSIERWMDARKNFRQLAAGESAMDGEGKRMSAQSKPEDAVPRRVSERGYREKPLLVKANTNLRSSSWYAKAAQSISAARAASTDQIDEEAE